MSRVSAVRFFWLRLGCTMKIPAPFGIRRGAPAWTPAARAATQVRPYNWAGTPTAIFIRCGEPQDHGNSVVKQDVLPLQGRCLNRKFRARGVCNASEGVKKSGTVPICEAE